MFRRVAEAAAAESVLVNPGVGPLAKRIEAFASIRLRSLSAPHAFGMLARRRLAGIESVQDRLDAITNTVPMQLTDQFEPEPTQMAHERCERVLDTLILLTSLESYDVLKRQHGSAGPCC